MNKEDLRKSVLKRRKKLNTEKISRKIVANIRNCKFYTDAKNILIFYPLKTEINLLDLLQDDDKKFFLPRVNKEELECCPYKIGDELIITQFGVKEPLTKAVSKLIIDLVFVPALCTDKSFNRLGYGKGFYDRFLSNYTGRTVIPIAEELVFNSITTESHDIACNGIITQKKASFERG